jgi:hypothetical protein
VLPKAKSIGIEIHSLGHLLVCTRRHCLVMKVLVTGSAGFVGFHTVNKWLGDGFDVVGLVFAILGIFNRG